MDPQPLVTGNRYWVVTPPGVLREPVRLFRDWLVGAFDEAMASAEQLFSDPKYNPRPC